MLRPKDLLQRRKERFRYKLRQVNKGARPRLCVYRTNQHFYAQIVDDSKGVTLVAASTVEQDLRKSLKNGGNKAAAAEVGKALAEKALKNGITSVVFDRSGYLYHGRVKALADAARESGLQF